MPNVELHGYGDNAAAMRQEVVEKLKTYSEPAEVVTTVFPTDVVALNGKKAPFLRLIAAPGDIDEIVGLLKPLFQDIEVFELTRWLPKG